MSTPVQDRPVPSAPDTTFEAASASAPAVASTPTPVAPEHTPAGPAPASTRTLTSITYTPPRVRRQTKTWWRAPSRPGDTTALSVIGGALVLALGVVALVIALAANGGFGTRTAATSGSGSGMPGMASSSANAATLGKTAAAQMPKHTTYPVAVPPVASGSGNVVDVHLTASEKLLAIAPGEAYHAWTFNGTVPGPVLHVRQGQTIHFTLTNDGTLPHSIDFHAAQTPWSTNYQPIGPGQSKTFDWVADYPGVFMYHCGTPPAMDHMANGMYGVIIVDPQGGWPNGDAQEFVLVQSEWYTQQNADTTYSLSENKLMAVTPDYVTFNGYADQYRDAPITAKAGERIRLFILNAGPSQFSAFHVIGAIFSDTYVDGNPANHLVGDQTITIPPGGGAAVELTMDQAGKYPFVTHSFSGAMTGATGVFNVQ
ncbi:MAG TPA: multicopper oxidase domain-containing protein [Ktedonobacterales bacterium]|nr:multicopper oxidase domain-containing protein [Ktedonobacterales bacterium]